MNSQQLIALLIVAVAAVYLGINFYRSLRAFLSAKSGGCGSGCGKCAFAAKDGAPRKRADNNASGRTVIPLTEIRSLPNKRSDR